MKIYDDQDRLHLSIVQKIQPGQMAIVSTGGMTSAIAECTGKTHNGIWIKDADGHPPTTAPTYWRPSASRPR